MDYEVEGYGYADFFQPIKDAEFLGVGFGAGDFLGGGFVGGLEAELEVVQAGFCELGEFRFVEGEARANQV